MRSINRYSKLERSHAKDELPLSPSFSVRTLNCSPNSAQFLCQAHHTSLYPTILARRRGDKYCFGSAQIGRALTLSFTLQSFLNGQLPERIPHELASYGGSLL